MTFHIVEVDHETRLHLEDSSYSRTLIGALVLKKHTVTWIRSVESAADLPHRSDSEIARVDKFLRANSIGTL